MAVPLVTIEGQIILPNGSHASGRIIAELSHNGKVSDGVDNQKVLARKVFAIPDSGDLADIDCTLVPNGAITPSNTYYAITYELTDRDGHMHPPRELWSLGGSGPSTINIGDITVLAGGGGAALDINDPDAIHDNESGEIAAISEKVTPLGADLVVIEDSAASNVKKKVQLSNLPAGAGGAQPVYTTTPADTRPAKTAANAYKPYVVKNAGEHAYGEIIYQRDDLSYEYFKTWTPF